MQRDVTLQLAEGNLLDLLAQQIIADLHRQDHFELARRFDIVAERRQGRRGNRRWDRADIGRGIALQFKRAPREPRRSARTPAKAALRGMICSQTGGLSASWIGLESMAPGFGCFALQIEPPHGLGGANAHPRKFAPRIRGST